MGCGQNSGRCFLLTVCCLQFASTVLRQVFDFLGFMWLPIIANFFNFIFVIFGFFGAYQYKPKYIITYTVWLVAWSTYNAFVMCFYLNVGVLDNSYDYLNFRTGSASWWEANGPGCQAVYPVDLSGLDLTRPLRPERVDGCLLSYDLVETVQAALQCLLALLGAGVSIYLLVVLTEEDDTCKAKMRATSIYSVEYSPNTEDSGDSIDMEVPAMGTLTSQYNSTNSTFLPPPPSGDMPSHTASLTPRRVKRHHRNRSSSRSRQQPPSHPTPESNFANNYTSGSVGSLAGVAGAARLHGRSSQRRSAGRQSGRGRRSQYVNPVTQLMDDSSTSTDSPAVVAGGRVANAGGRLGGHGGVGAGGRLGHSNPMYVHSRPASLHSLASTAVVADPIERPPSVHSSYSNYHGVRASLNQANLNSASSPDKAGVSPTSGMLGNLPHGSGGLQFGRALPHQAGKGLRGSQNSILSSSEQRRTALTTSEIRVPSSVPSAVGPSAVVPSSAVDDTGPPAARNGTVAPAARNGTVVPAGGNSQLSPSTVTSVTSVSPASVTSSSTQNTTFNGAQYGQQHNYHQEDQQQHRQQNQYHVHPLPDQRFQQPQQIVSSASQYPHQHSHQYHQQHQHHHQQQQQQKHLTASHLHLQQQHSHQDNNNQYHQVAANHPSHPAPQNYNNSSQHFNYPPIGRNGNGLPPSTSQYPSPSSPAPSSPPYSTVFGAVLPNSAGDDEMPPPYVGDHT